jgi:hypothetical protein
MTAAGPVVIDLTISTHDQAVPTGHQEDERRMCNDKELRSSLPTDPARDVAGFQYYRDQCGTIIARRLYCRTGLTVTDKNAVAGW